jgi:hypothetical protein
MQLKSFADFSVIFRERFITPLWERYPLRERNSWDALCLFLEGYAFERQGRHPDYGPAAVDSIMKAKSKGRGLKREHVSEVWNDFKAALVQVSSTRPTNLYAHKEPAISAKQVGGLPRRNQFWSFSLTCQLPGHRLTFLCMRSLNLLITD